ncbi:MAG: phosphoglucomutase/phosphomannomutase family protein [Candidatus Acetothermia bacterium]|jgi:phosphomannomutase|nr:phosphoglucomutase/phosphomannomutase family protein [Candidatus Acetothermia bacterium]MDH7505578.1 phosphoglucomutase/phosphomannomutase family protein [Candidatus Acetothermia bacterium]
MPQAIQFGTDGWRGVLAEDFTFENVGRVAQALADFLKSPQRRDLEIYRDWGVEYRQAEHGVLVGYDTRFMSRDFAVYLGRVLRSNEIPVCITAEPVPSPALAWAVLHHRAACGVMITSSHNPYQYNGIKLKPEFGGSAPPQYTKMVEGFLSYKHKLTAGEEELQEIELKEPYLARIKELVDLDLLRSAPLQVVVDAMYGSARGYIPTILEELGIEHVAIRAGNDPYFGGKNPEPIMRNLVPLKAVIRSERTRAKNGRLTVGVVTDGDGDRVAGMDEAGSLIDSHRAYALIFRHLLAKGLRGKAVKSISLTDMADRIAERNGIELEQTPVGFKFIGEKMVREDVLIGGEESGGIGIKGHIPERDGILNSLLLLEIVARERRPLSAIVQTMMEELGYHYYDRRDLALEARLELVEHLKLRPPGEFAGRRVVAVETLDGVKLRFTGGWLLFRASGTEPLLRLYCEMPSPEEVQEVLSEAEHYARGERKLW